ncbi:MAG: hypothetical protein O3A85_13730 [Proteobacteria bacterium]|nr:hypothetical protein [Pseudomonadota bacterium]
MSIGQTLAVAVSGLKTNALKIHAAANNVVNQNSDGYRAVRIETVSRVTSRLATGGGVVTRLRADGEVDLALEFTRMMEAQAAYGANAEVIRTVEEMEREAVNIIA